MAAFLLALVCGHLFFYRLGEAQVQNDAEARVLLTASEMNRNSTWIIPTVKGEDRWEKPPLYVWCVKLASKFSNDVTPLAGRIPAAVSIMLLVMLCGWWTYQHIQRYPREDHPDMLAEVPSLLTGLIIASSPMIFKAARSGSPDAMFAALCFGALYCFGESFESRRSFYSSRPWRHWVLAGYFLIGLAMMTKGPVVFLFVLIPYVLTCFAYKMRVPDWIHLPGVAIAAITGGWWYASAIALDPQALNVFISELFVRRFGASAQAAGPIYFYLELFIELFLPWNLLAIILCWRSLVRRDRTPTRSMWTWGLVGSVIWLSIVGTKREEYFLPAAPFALLLAGDALVQWDFDSKIGLAFRVLLRTLRWAAILVAIPFCVIIASDLGLGMAIALAVACFAFLFYRRRITYVYAMWERTMHGAWFLVVVFLAALNVYIQDIIPRQKDLSDHLGFIAQVKNHLPDESRLYLFGGEDSAIYSYYMDKLVPITKSVTELSRPDQPLTYLLSDSDVKDLIEHPNLAPVVVKYGGSSRRPRAALLRVLREDEVGTTPTLQRRYSLIPPLRIAVVGDSASDSENQRDVSKRMFKLSLRHPLDGVVSLGNNLAGDSKLERLDFLKSFERPFGDLLDEGVPFYGVMGERDEDIGWFMRNYPLLQMHGERHYATSLNGELAALFVLDSLTLSENSDDATRDLEWLDKELGKCPHPWKIVALYRPFMSRAEKNENKNMLADRLLPILDKHGVQIVISADERWYQRVEDANHKSVFFGGGWGGKTESTEFTADAAFKRGYHERPGFIYFEIAPDQAKFAAINDEGDIVDQGFIAPDGGSFEGTGGPISVSWGRSKDDESNEDDESK